MCNIINIEFLKIRTEQISIRVCCDDLEIRSDVLFRVPKVEGIVIKELEICILEKPEKLEKDRPSSVIRSDNYVSNRQ